MVAPLIDQLKSSPQIPFKIFLEDNSSVYLDVSDEDTCNWMCLVAPSKGQLDGNLVAYQLEQNVFFSTQKQISPGEELRVAYAPPYGRKVAKALGEEERFLNGRPLEEASNVRKRKFSKCNLKETTVGFKLGRKFKSIHDASRFNLRTKRKTLILSSDSEDAESEFDSDLPDFVESPNELEEQNFNYDAIESNENFTQDFQHNQQHHPQPLIVQELLNVATLKIMEVREIEESAESLLALGKSIVSEAMQSRVSFEPSNDNRSLRSCNDTAVILKPLEESLICPLCYKKQNSKNSLYRHLLKHSKAYYCPNCELSFSRKESLNKHRCQSVASRTCSFCGKKFNREVALQKHLVQHLSRFHCGICGKNYINKNSLTLHSCFQKLSNSPCLCDTCGRKFSKECDLDKHNSVHTGLFVCRFCGEWLRSIESLTNHLVQCGKVKDIEVNGVQCNVCDDWFEDVTNYRKHAKAHTHPFHCTACEQKFVLESSMNTHICQTPSLICEVCEETFIGLRNLEEHKAIHGIPQIKCDICKYSCFTVENLKEHCCATLDLQSNAASSATKKENGSFRRKMLACEICGCLQATLSNLKKHRKLHEEKKFDCHVCRKVFHRKDTLIEHQLVHSEPTVQCPICRRLCKTKKSLNVHMQIHAGVKKFLCSQCGKAFSQKCNLQKHEGTHNKEQVFLCDVCAKPFANKESLRIHLLMHRKGLSHLCKVCGKMFLMKHQLLLHNRTSHENLSYLCKYCGTVVKLRYSLKRHLKKRHSEMQIEWSKPDVIKSMFGNHFQEIGLIKDQDSKIAESDSKSLKKEDVAFVLQSDCQLRDNLEVIQNEVTIPLEIVGESLNIDKNADASLNDFSKCEKLIETEKYNEDFAENDFQLDLMRDYEVAELIQDSPRNASELGPSIDESNIETEGLKLYIASAAEDGLEYELLPTVERDMAIDAEAISNQHIVLTEEQLKKFQLNSEQSFLLEDSLIVHQEENDSVLLYVLATNGETPTENDQ